MDIIGLLEGISPTFYAFFLGSILTIIGVVLTNISNTKRLRMQHEYEREMRNKERDLNMRREVYMGAMEAISAGVTAVSRFSELSETPEALMESYSKLSPSLGKVTIVGENKTIEALGNFQLELNGAFLRLSAKREKFDRLIQENETMENKIASLEEEVEHLSRALIQAENEGEDSETISRIQQQYDLTQQRLADLQVKGEEVGNRLMSQVVKLVQAAMEEAGSLNNLLAPLISLMRKELELPFNEEHFAQILKEGNQALIDYMATFFENFGTDQELE